MAAPACRGYFPDIAAPFRAAFTQQLLLDVREARPLPLPFRRLGHARDLHCRDLVLGAVGGPVGTVGGDDVGAGLGSGRWCIPRPAAPGRSGSRAAPSPERLWMPTQSPSFTPRSSDVLRMDLQHVLAVPHDVRRAAGLRALYCDRMRPVVKSNGKRRVLRSSVGTYLVIMNLPLPRTKASMCMIGVPSGAPSLHGHCRLPSLSGFHG